MGFNYQKILGHQKRKPPLKGAYVHRQFICLFVCTLKKLRDALLFEVSQIAR